MSAPAAMGVEDFHQLHGIDRNTLEGQKVAALIGPPVQQHGHRPLGDADRDGLAWVGHVIEAIAANGREMGRQIGAVAHFAGDPHLEYGEITADRQAHPRHHAVTHHAHAHAMTAPHAPAVLHAAHTALHHLLGHFRQDALERQAAQGHFGSLAASAEIGPDIQPLARGDHHVGTIFRHLEQAAVDADDGDRRAVAPAQLVNAGSRPVQHTQAIGTAGDLEFGIGPTVDEDLVTIETDHPVVHGGTVDHLILFVEAAILNDHGEFVFSAGKPQLGLLVIIDDQATRQPVIHLTGRRFMRMRVINVEPGAVQHLEFIDPGLAIADDMVRVPVHVGRHVQPVPMGDTRLGQLVVKMDADFLPLVQADDGAKIAARNFRHRFLRSREQFRRVAVNPRGLAG